MKCNTPAATPEQKQARVSALTGESEDVLYVELGAGSLTTEATDTTESSVEISGPRAEEFTGSINSVFAQPDAEGGFSWERVDLSGELKRALA